MSALHTPRFPRRDTLCAHPQPRTARPQAEYAFITRIASKQRSPHNSGHGCTHRRVPNRRHSLTALTNNSQTSVKHRQTNQQTAFAPTATTVAERQLCSQWPKTATTTKQTGNHSIRTFESINHHIHSFIHTFITFNHSSHSLITFIHSFIIQSGTTGGRGEVC